MKLELSKGLSLPRARLQHGRFWLTPLVASVLSCGTQSPSGTEPQSSQSTSSDAVESSSSAAQPTNSPATSTTSLAESETRPENSTQAASTLTLASSGATSSVTTAESTTPVASDAVTTSDSAASTSTVVTSSAETSSATTGEPTPTSQTSAELLAAFDLGWNLGNSLDVPEGETEWGNPSIDAALLQTIADAGFDVVRIPVTWSMFTGAAPSYTLDAARLTRVQEVVGYALDAGLHAIINLHHDGADELDGVEWLTLNDESGAITDANNQVVEERFRAVWTQIAEHFKNFDQRLLFESMNEIHDGYDAPDPEYYTIINHLNQVFVDIIRGSGGNNTSRHLVVPGYNTNIDYTLAGFEAPTDPTKDHLILSVHYYDPWSFAGEGSTTVWGNGAAGADSWGQEDHVVSQFDALKSTYVDKGLPMIIGEYGAVNVAGSENYRRYYMEYVTAAACQRGIVPIYWDNGGTGTGADSFGLFNRTSKQVVFPDILEAMFRGCSATSLDSIARP